MKGSILIVGGYGTVGQVAATRLAERYPGQVIAAGRKYDKANELSKATNRKILPLAFDILVAHETPEILDDVALVIMSLDLPNTRFAEMCLQNGVDYVDVTATYAYLAQVEALNEVAQAGGGTAVLSVGIAPGLTNLLVSHAKSQYDDLQQLDIHVLLGLGETHGEAAVRWMVENLNRSFSVQENGKAKLVKNFGDGEQTVFPAKLGRRTTYRFDFSDQHVLPRTLGINTVSTRIGFESALITDLIALAKKIGLFYLLRYQRAQDVLVQLLRMLRLGTELFVAQVDAQGLANGQRQTSSSAVSGDGEGRITGLVAAQVAERLIEGNFQSGVFHIEQLFEPFPFIIGLEADGLRFHIRKAVNW
ncbi:MAG: saccharopine dehydrogenase NADP-binding domain-containing protein [Candidatus Promineifilaceae bacterium]